MSTTCPPGVEAWVPRRYVQREDPPAPEPAPAPATATEAPIASASKANDAGPAASAATGPSGGTAPWRVSLTSKVVERTAEHWRYSWRITLANGMPSPQSFDAQIVFSDATGGVIDSARVPDLEVAAGDQRTFTGESLVALPGAINVAHADAVVKRRE